MRGSGKGQGQRSGSLVAPGLCTAHIKAPALGGGGGRTQVLETALEPNTE